MFDYSGRLSYRGYTKSVENIWKVSVWVEYVLVFINGMYVHQKLFIFKNGIITYHKYRKENFGIKEDLEIVIEKSNRVQVKFKGKALFVCMALVIDSLCIFLCYIVNKTFNIEPVKYLYKYLDDIQREYKFKGEKLSNAEQIYYYVNNYNNWNDFSM